MFFVEKNVNLRVPGKLHSGWWQAAFARAPRLRGWRSPLFSMSVAKWLRQGPLLDNQHSLTKRVLGKRSRAQFAALPLLCLHEKNAVLPPKTPSFQVPLFMGRLPAFAGPQPGPLCWPFTAFNSEQGRAAQANEQSTHCFRMSQTSSPLPLASTCYHLYFRELPFSLYVAFVRQNPTF